MQQIFLFILFFILYKAEIIPDNIREFKVVRTTNLDTFTREFREFT